MVETGIGTGETMKACLQPELSLLWPELTPHIQAAVRASQNPLECMSRIKPLLRKMLYEEPESDVKTILWQPLPDQDAEALLVDVYALLIVVFDPDAGNKEFFLDELTTRLMEAGLIVPAR